MKNSPALREFALMALPCALFLGITLLNSNNSRNEPNIDYAPPMMPTPTPAGFYVSVDRFASEKITPNQAARGADTSVRIETWLHKAPKNVRWYSARRLVAIKNGRSRVLWDGQQNSSPLVLPAWGEYGEEMRGSTLLFKLRNVPTDAGELVFAWDALAQPVNHKLEVDNEKLVDIATLQRQAKSGGVRLSRRLTLRYDGQKISAVNFPDSKLLRARSGKLFLLEQPDENGNDVQIEFRVAYYGPQRESQISLESIALADERGRSVEIRSYQGGAERVGKDWIFRAGTKRANLHGAKHFRLFVIATDGHSKLQKLYATATLETNAVN